MNSNVISTLQRNINIEWGGRGEPTDIAQKIAYRSTIFGQDCCYNESISGCVHMACDSLLTTSLLQVVHRLVASWFKVVTSLQMTSCNELDFNRQRCFFLKMNTLLYHLGEIFYLLFHTSRSAIWLKKRRILYPSYKFIYEMILKIEAKPLLLQF